MDRVRNSPRRDRPVTGPGRVPARSTAHHQEDTHMTTTDQARGERLEIRHPGDVPRSPPCPGWWSSASSTTTGS
ncbi:hypothetical protein ACFQV4_29725 [Streptomyces thermocarboxydus]